MYSIQIQYNWTQKHTIKSVQVECSICTVYKSNNTSIPYSAKFSRDKFFADWPFRKFAEIIFVDWGSGQLATPSLMRRPPPCAIKPFVDTCAGSNSGEVWQPKRSALTQLFVGITRTKTAGMQLSMNRYLRVRESLGTARIPSLWQWWDHAVELERYPSVMWPMKIPSVCSMFLLRAGGTIHCRVIASRHY